MDMLGLWGCPTELANVSGGRAGFLEVFRGIEIDGVVDW